MTTSDLDAIARDAEELGWEVVAERDGYHRLQKAHSDHSYIQVWAVNTDAGVAVGAMVKTGDATVPWSVVWPLYQVIDKHTKGEDT